MNFYEYINESEYNVAIININGDYSRTKPYSNYKEEVFTTFAPSEKKAISNVKDQIFRDIWKDQNIRISQTEKQVRDSINRAFEFDLWRGDNG